MQIDVLYFHLSVQDVCAINYFAAGANCCLYSTDSVCKDILTKAGPQVEAILKTGEKNK